MAEDPSSGNSIKITDKRHFESNGSRRRPDEERHATASTSQRSPGGGLDEGPLLMGAEFTARPAEASGASENAPDEGGLPAVDLSTLVLSFRTSALVHLGLMRDPASGEGGVNLDGARQMIDILSMLRQKTAGNLDAEEERLLDQVLYELRLHYVNLTSGRSSR